MKQKFLLITLLCCGFIYNTVKANESEPNNDRANANTLALNGSNSGEISPVGDQDWWKITTTGDGKLDVTLTPSGKYTWIYLYDNDGTTLLNSAYSTGTFTVSQDGLAAGTYYVKIVCFYSTETTSYTISDVLTQPAQTNDAEPNNSKAQALTLPQNGSKTGHVGYYYNNYRDTADWYKVTTNGDGLLSLSLTPANGKYVWVYLYDNDGTTLLNSGYSTAAFDVNTDGLVAGTYYIKIICFYSNSDFAPYTLSNTLTKPSDANDAEPNDTKAQAVTLALNDNTTGHTGYYYKNHRDSADWYKLTTNKDGYLRLSLTPENGKYVWIYLYDQDGTTLINSSYSTTAFNQYTDGLAAGTYYIRINCFYNTQFAPYSLSDSLFTYTYAADAEPNGHASQAKTLPVNTETPGHVGFYYNNARDSIDWWKINYTGSGPLTVTMNLEGDKCCGIQYTWMDIYKDTAGSTLYSSYTSSSSLVANLSALTQGYYWVRVHTFYNDKFMAYSLTPTFTQTVSAAIKVFKYDTLASCGSTNYIRFRPFKSNAPYTVQLYRFGTKYGDAIIAQNAGDFAKFENLPVGSYYATVYGDGATGNAYGTSAIVQLEPVPANPNTTNIKIDRATLNWDLQDCADYYVVKYRQHGATTWIKKQTVGNVNTFKIFNLHANTTYEWVVSAADSANGIEAKSLFTDSLLFTTPSALIAGSDNNEEDMNAASLNHNISVMVSPNPATNFFVIHYNSSTQNKVNASVYNANGKAIWSSGLINAGILNGKQVNASQFAKGVFYLKITNEQGELIGSTKIIIAN